jgi:hypothetical protein
MFATTLSSTQKNARMAYILYVCSILLFVAIFIKLKLTLQSYDEY